MVREFDQPNGNHAVSPAITVVVPTLAAGETLAECIEALQKQSFRDFELIVVDNSGKRLVQPSAFVKVIANQDNVGFGAAINQAFRESNAPFLAVLNDDATPHPAWLEALLKAIGSRRDIGMCASQIRLASDGRLDSAGMLLCADGSSKQRGHMDSPEKYARPQEALFPSGCAALYRREMLNEIGLFDEGFFLYCEDTDLGLRARWAGWECLYVPGALVDHRYSHSAGRASAVKAYYVERNRLFVTVKNFPLGMLVMVPFHSLARYCWHAYYASRGQGAAARYKDDGNSSRQLGHYVFRAHIEVIRNWRRLWNQRRQLKRRLTSKQFGQLIRLFSISARQVAAL